MDDHSQFLNQLRKKALGMNENANAEEQSTPHPQQSSGDAQTEKSDASSASERQEDLREDTLVGLDAAQECSVCKRELESVGESPRPLKRLPERITQDGFRHSTIPVHLCPVCDGEALELASRQFEV